MDKKIKILRIITRLNIGGPSIHAALLSGSLNNERFTSVLVSGSPGRSEGDMGYLIRKDGCRMSVLPQLSREISPIRDFVAFCKLFSIICKEKPDVVHTHMAKAGALGRLAAFLYKVITRRNCVVIHTFHGHVLSGYFSPRKTRVFIRIERFLARLSDRIIVISRAIEEELLAFKICGSKKITKIRLGLDLEDLLSLDYKINKELSVGIIGRLVSIKNHLMFLDVARKLIDSGLERSIKFVIVGDGELRAMLEVYARKLGLENNVIFTGWQRNLVQIYSQLDIITLTSLNEGTPVCLIEAMAAARPVVATNVGGVRDVVSEERGFLIEPGDIEGFAGAIKIFLEDEQLRKRKGQAGREFVKNNFRKERLVREIEQLYNEELKERIK